MSIFAALPAIFGFRSSIEASDRRLREAIAGLGPVVPAPQTPRVEAVLPAPPRPSNRKERRADGARKRSRK